MITWLPIRLTGADALASRASKKLKVDDLLVTSLGSTILRKHLDEVPLWCNGHVEVKQLVEDFAKYLYLPRLAGPEVLVQACRNGISLLTWESETFAFAEGFDEAAGRYQGLSTQQLVTLSPESSGLLVKPDIARKQLKAETSARSASGTRTKRRGRTCWSKWQGSLSKRRGRCPNT